MPVNWFDLVVLTMILVGIFRGRKRGISEEMLDVVQWLLIVVAGAHAYRPLGGYISDFSHFSRGFSYAIAYIFVAVMIKLLFSWIKHAVGEKLVHSDVFGWSEYYLGMLAGALRFTCILIVCLSVLNSVYISPAQLAAEAKIQRDNFGTITFPTIGSIQQDVFVNSVSGPYIKQYLHDQLISAVEAPASGPTPARRREKMIDEIMSPKGK